MKRTITRLFQENQHKLNEKPTPRAWRKLERRLDGHRSSKWTIYRQLSAVAAALLLIMLFSVIASYLERSENSNVAGKIEELAPSDPNSEASRTMAFTRQFRDRLASAIEEGDFTKRLTLALPATESQVKVSMADFKWLEGEWKNSSNDQTSTETWKRRNAQMLEGTGMVFSAKGDTVFSEQMRIYNTGTKVYFETTLASGQPPVRYALKQFFADRILFENTEVDFPQQVVIERHSPNVYSFILQNEALMGISESQQKFLNHRNKMVNQHIIRVMERAEYK